MPPFEYEHGSTCRRVVPEYSTDITAAWEVVEKLNLLDEPNILTRGRGGLRHRLADDWAVVAVDKSGAWITTASAATAPLAICRAALKAVGA